MNQRLHNIQLVPFSEACQTLGISKASAYNLRWRGDFPVPIVRVAGRLKVRLRDLEKFIETGAAVR